MTTLEAADDKSLAATGCDRGARIVSVGSDGVDRHYLIVSGPAASGKTLVARGLSHELGWPIFAKDTIKAAHVGPARG
jgi:ATP-dependent protease Clp ATPase subunit